MKGERKPHFMNVDLDLKSRADLAPLVARLARRASVLRSDRHRGLHCATFELLSSRQHTPERCIAGLARLIEGLPVTERRLTQRIFDVGIQAGADGHVFRPTITTATLARVAALRAALTVTVYPYGWGEKKTSPRRVVTDARGP